MKKAILAVLVFFTCHSFQITNCFSQDLRGADFSLKQLQGQGDAFEGRLNLFVDSALNINRPYEIVYWAQGQDTLFFSSQVSANPGVIKKEYVGTIVYPSSGNYTVFFQDTFRIANISNIVNSQTEPLTISHFHIVSPFINNSSPAIILDQSYIVQNSGIYTYSPVASDPDGDSLHFELIPCQVANYTMPDSITMDPYTGELKLFAINTGVYAVAYKLEEWRSGLRVASSEHNMLIDATVPLSIWGNQEERENSNVYPNPTNGSFTLETNFAKNEKLSIMLYNLMGEKVITVEENAPAGNYKRKVNMDELPSGFYFLSLQTESRAFIQKIMKQ
jgi:hypothetical protein